MAEREAMHKLRELETKLVGIYRDLEELARHSEVPMLAKNCQRALASVWQVLNNLGVLVEQNGTAGGED